MCLSVWGVNYVCFGGWFLLSQASFPYPLVVRFACGLPVTWVRSATQVVASVPRHLSLLFSGPPPSLGPSLLRGLSPFLILKSHVPHWHPMGRPYAGIAVAPLLGVFLCEYVRPCCVCVWGAAFVAAAWLLHISSYLPLLLAIPSKDLSLLLLASTHRFPV